MQLPSRISFRLQIGAVLALAALLSFARPAAGEDTQLWSEATVRAKLSKRFDLLVGSEVRFGNDVSHHDRTSVEAGLAWHPTKWFTLSPRWEYITDDPVDDVSGHENRFLLVTALRLPVECVEATLSARVEYRLRHAQSDGWRIRPKFKLEHDLGPRSWDLAAYTSDELFYDTRAAEWTRNRFYAGLEKKLGKDLSLDLSYCRQHDLHSRDPDLNIIGVSMRLELD
jgi:hypothetical protein